MACTFPEHVCGIPRKPDHACLACMTRRAEHADFCIYEDDRTTCSCGKVGGGMEVATRQYAAAMVARDEAKARLVATGEGL